MKRAFDLVLAAFLAVLISPLVLLISAAVKLTSKGPIFYWSDRVGIDNLIFSMPKFRTMKTDTPAVATHLLKNPDLYLTPIGAFLRKTSLDEIPQLYSILRGQISFVGPRPALFNQEDLVAMRTAKGIHRILPGLTGWAQVNGRDHMSIPEKVSYDEYYLKHGGFLFDLKILAMTFFKVLRAEGVSH